MATYYADSVNGNDSNDGLTPATAKKTINAVAALCVAAGDIAELNEGTYTLSAHITKSVSTTFRHNSLANPENVIINGNYYFTATSGAYLSFEGLVLKNAAAANGSNGTIFSSAATCGLIISNCTFDGAAYSLTNALRFSGIVMSIKNTTFKNYNIVNPSGAGSGFAYEDCKFENIKDYVTAQFSNSDFISCQFTKIKNVVLLYSDSLSAEKVSFSECTFDLVDGVSSGVNGSIIGYNSTLNGDLNGLRFKDCIVYRTNKIINKIGAGVLTLSFSPFIKNNWIQLGTDLTGYISYSGDITSESDPQFYNANDGDYRLEPTSSAAVANNGLHYSMGANQLETPLAFFTDPTESNVKAGTNYKFNSRVVNRTGTHSGTALLPVDKVAIGYDRGDGLLGTYAALERYTDAGENNTKYGVPYRFNSLTNNRTGTNLNTSPGVGNVVAGTTWYLDSVLQTGTRTSIYALLSQAVVKIGTDRGDGQLGTYDGSDRWSDPGVANVRLSTAYKANSTSNNRTGTAIIPAATNVRFGIGVDNTTGLLDLPAISDVLLGVVYDNGTKTGTKAFYPLLAQAVVKIGTDRGDGVIGNYDGSDRYTDPGIENVKAGVDYRFNSLVVNREGNYEALSDYPIESNVLAGIIYDFGARVGTLGQINLADTNLATVLTNNAKAVIQGTLGSDFSELKYFKEVEKNDFYSNAKTFGIRCMDDKLTNEKVGLETLDLQFEIKLTSDFNNRDGDDDERVQELALIQSMEKIRRSLRETKFGYSNNVRIVKEWERDEISKVGGNVLLCRAVLKVNINVKNG